MKNKGNTIYYKGDKARATGDKDSLYGGEFIELEILEGHRSGDLVWVDVEHHSVLAIEWICRAKNKGEQNEK